MNYQLCEDSDAEMTPAGVWLNDRLCTHLDYEHDVESLTERAEIIRDGLREDGINP